MLKTETISSTNAFNFSKMFNKFLDENHIEYKQIYDVQFKILVTTLSGDFASRAYTEYVALVLYETKEQ